MGITRKKKGCSERKKEAYIWGHGKCKPCASKDYKKPKPIADKRKEQLKDYSVLRKEFLEAQPNCMAKLIGCLGKSDQVHHANKRFGKRLNETEHFIALCQSCHSQIEDSM